MQALKRVSRRLIRKARKLDKFLDYLPKIDFYHDKFRSSLLCALLFAFFFFKDFYEPSMNADTHRFVVWNPDVTIHPVSKTVNVGAWNTADKPKLWYDVLQRNEIQYTALAVMALGNSDYTMFPQHPLVIVPGFLLFYWETYAFISQGVYLVRASDPHCFDRSGTEIDAELTNDEIQRKWCGVGADGAPEDFLGPACELLTSHLECQEEQNIREGCASSCRALHLDYEMAHTCKTICESDNFNSICIDCLAVQTGNNGICSAAVTAQRECVKFAAQKSEAGLYIVCVMMLRVALACAALYAIFRGNLRRKFGFLERNKIVAKCCLSTRLLAAFVLTFLIIVTFTIAYWTQVPKPLMRYADQFEATVANLMRPEFAKTVRNLITFGLVLVGITWTIQVILIFFSIYWTLEAFANDVVSNLYFEMRKQQREGKREFEDIDLEVREMLPVALRDIPLKIRPQSVRSSDEFKATPGMLTRLKAWPRLESHMRPGCQQTIRESAPWSALTFIPAMAASQTLFMWVIQVIIHVLAVAIVAFAFGWEINPTIAGITFRKRVTDIIIITIVLKQIVQNKLAKPIWMDHDLIKGVKPNIPFLILAVCFDLYLNMGSGLSAMWVATIAGFALQMILVIGGLVLRPYISVDTLLQNGLYHAYTAQVFTTVYRLSRDFSISYHDFDSQYVTPEGTPEAHTPSLEQDGQ